MRIGSLCTGYGGLDMAAQRVFGGRLRWVSDVDPGPIALLAHHYPDVPNLGDLKTVDWATVELVDLLTAGYPCQPFSNAGKRLGTEDPRHLWPWIARAIGALRPRIVVLENVAAHLRKGFDVVLADLAGLGYDVAWSIVRASDTGAAHQRARLFIVATDAAREPVEGSLAEAVPARGAFPPDGLASPVPDTESVGRREGGPQPAQFERGPDAAHDREPLDWQEFEPAIRQWERRLGRPAPAPSVFGPRGGVKVSPAFGEWLMGLPEGRITDVPGLSINEQLKLVGNGVVPQQAEHAIRYLTAQLVVHDAA